MKTSLSFIALCLVALSACANAFVPSASRPLTFATASSATKLSAKYKTMDEILALFPEDKPVLINFYDASTEKDIKADIVRAKQLLEDRAKVVSIKQQDYPELAKLWDCADRSPGRSPDSSDVRVL